MTAAWAARNSDANVGYADVPWDLVGGSAGDLQLLFLDAFYLGQTVDVDAAMAALAAAIEARGEGWTVLAYRNEPADNAFWWTDITTLVAAREMDGTETSANRPRLTYSVYTPLAALIRHGCILHRVTDWTLADVGVAQQGSYSTQAQNPAVTLAASGCVVSHLAWAWRNLQGDAVTAPSGYTLRTGYTDFGVAGYAQGAYRNSVTAGAQSAINWTGTFDASRYWQTSTVAIGTLGATMERGIVRAASPGLTAPGKARSYLGIPDDPTFLDPVAFPPAAEPGIDPPGNPY